MCLNEVLVLPCRLAESSYLLLLFAFSFCFLLLFELRHSVARLIYAYPCVCVLSRLPILGTVSDFPCDPPINKCIEI